ncbi:MAG: enoyl-CoA hydratase [Bdellovibrionota bacterium]|nr:MAG: enoyl-CoA hydratase [Pseudomonadota bacterium]
MNSAHIQIQENEGILEIVISRPERKNAFTAEMYAAFAGTLRAAADADRIKVVILSGQGGNYSTGNDLKDFLEAPPTSEKDPVFQFLRAIAEFPKPLIAAVEGFAVGVGMTMLLHADLVYATPSAKFQLPFTNLGLVPEAGSSYLLPLLVGHLKASELCLLGEAIDAETALKLGVVNDLVSPEELMNVARAKAKIIALKPGFAIQQTKLLLKGAHMSPLLVQMKKEENLFLKLLKSPEAIEFIKGFFSRKK